jgi:hypothetical protein
VGLFQGLLYGRRSEAEARDQACSFTGFNSAMTSQKPDLYGWQLCEDASLTVELLTKAKGSSAILLKSL